jgi:hypothetical protein
MEVADMPTFKLPLSGDVSQNILPWTAFFNGAGAQYRLVNINLGKSSDPRSEEEILSDVGTNGRQIGRIEEALAVLLDHFHPRRPLEPREQDAIDDLREMLNEVAAIKKKHRRSELTIARDAATSSTYSP